MNEWFEFNDSGFAVGLKPRKLRLYADHNFPFAVVEELRHARIPVMTAAEDGRASHDDSAVYARAKKLDSCSSPSTGTSGTTAGTRSKRGPESSLLTFLPSLALGLEGGVALSHLFDAVTAGEWILGTLFFGIPLAILIRIIFAVLRVRSLLAKMDEDTAGFYLWAPLGGAAAVALYVNQTHHTWWQWLIGVPFGAMAIGFCLAVAYMAAYFGSIKVAEWHGWQPPRRNDKWERLEAQFKAAHEAEFRELYELEARL